MPGADDKNKESGTSVVEIKVPDIGDFDDFHRIEIADVRHLDFHHAHS